MAVHWFYRVGGAEMKSGKKGTEAWSSNDDGTGLIFIRKFPRIRWYIIKTKTGVVVYDGGDEREAAKAAVKHQERNAKLTKRLK